jgi:hypothetical protein
MAKKNAAAIFEAALFHWRSHVRAKKFTPIIRRNMTFTVHPASGYTVVMGFRLELFH